MSRGVTIGLKECVVSPGRKIVLVSPNISEQMGGEAIKAYQFLRHLSASGADICVVTHRRSAALVKADFPEIDVRIVEDSFDQVFVWNSIALRPFISSLFFIYARRTIRAVLAEWPDAVLHYLCPVSPIQPRFPLRGANNVVGPLTGNIYYPPAFRDVEPLTDKLRRWLHYGAQRAMRALARDNRYFGRVLVSGGERTRRSLSWGGFPDDAMRDVVDSGISDAFQAHPLIRHVGENFRFMTSGRLVPHKGVQLTIEALRHVTKPIVFDVYGDGKYGPALKRLAHKLGVADKVRFLGWMESHDALIARMADYRGYLVPSLAEANGIVVQEAMMAGLPVVCLKWGGPAMLADDASAILIEPSSHEHVVRAIAAALDALAVDPARANALAAEARLIAERRFTWDDVVREWQDAYTTGGTVVRPAVMAPG